MGWWSRKPEKDDIYIANLPDNNENKLSGVHPVIVEEVNKDNTVLKVIGCTSKEYQAKKFNAPEVKTKSNGLDQISYARADQGLRELSDKDFANKRLVDKVLNSEEVRKKLK
jgi:PemK-like, MazF-like toxin of type II toxin-antitoxin system